MCVRVSGIDKKHRIMRNKKRDTKREGRGRSERVWTMKGKVLRVGKSKGETRSGKRENVANCMIEKYWIEREEWERA